MEGEAGDIALEVPRRGATALAALLANHTAALWRSRRCFGVLVLPLVPLFAVAQGGWFSATGVVQHSLYSSEHSRYSSPSGEFEGAIAYRQMLGKRAGLWVGWSYGTRSFTREDTYVSGGQDFKFDYAEHSLFAGLSIEAARSEKSHVTVNLGFGSNVFTTARWTLLSSTSVPNAVTSSDFQAPFRKVFKLGVRYARRISHNFWLTGGPSAALVVAPRDSYIGGSEATGRYIRVDDGRVVIGFEVGLELGPLLSQRD